MQRGQQLDRVLHRHNFIEPVPQDFYQFSAEKDVDDICLAHEALTTDNEEYKSALLGKIRNPKILSWYDENVAWESSVPNTPTAQNPISSSSLFVPSSISHEPQFFQTQPLSTSPSSSIRSVTPTGQEYARYNPTSPQAQARVSTPTTPSVFMQGSSENPWASETKLSTGVGENEIPRDIYTVSMAELPIQLFEILELFLFTHPEFLHPDEWNQLARYGFFDLRKHSIAEILHLLDSASTKSGLSASINAAANSSSGMSPISINSTTPTITERMMTLFTPADLQKWGINVQGITGARGFAKGMIPLPPNRSTNSSGSTTSTSGQDQKEKEEADWNSFVTNLADDFASNVTFADFQYLVGIIVSLLNVNQPTT